MDGNGGITRRRQWIRAGFLVLALVVFWDMMRLFMTAPTEPKYPPERIALIAAIFGFIAGWISAGAAFLFGGSDGTGPPES